MSNAIAKPAWPALQRGHPLAPGLLLACPFAESAGGTINDLSGNHDTASVLGGAPWAGSPWGSALALNGTSQGATIPYAAALDSSATTISFMMFPTAAVVSGNYTTLFAQGYNGTSVPRFFDCRVNPVGPSSGTTLCFCNFDGLTLTGVSSGLDLNVSANLNQWYLVIGTCDASGNSAIYLNGVLKASGSGMSLSSNTKAFNLGYLDVNGSNGRFFSGSIQNLRIWNRVLSASEVAQDYLDPFAIYRPVSHWGEIPAAAGAFTNRPGPRVGPALPFGLAISSAYRISELLKCNPVVQRRKLVRWWK